MAVPSLQLQENIRWHQINFNIFGAVHFVHRLSKGLLIFPASKVPCVPCVNQAIPSLHIGEVDKSIQGSYPAKISENALRSTIYNKQPFLQTHSRWIQINTLWIRCCQILLGDETLETGTHQTRWKHKIVCRWDLIFLQTGFFWGGGGRGGHGRGCICISLHLTSFKQIQMSERSVF